MKETGMNFGAGLSAREGWGRAASDPKWLDVGGGVLQRRANVLGGTANKIQRGPDNKWESVDEKPRRVAHLSAEYLPVVLTSPQE